MFFLTIKLTFVQMYNIGIHLGHTLKKSKFLSYWVYGGWRSNLFIINLVKTRVILKTMITVLQGSVTSYKPIWFINLDKNRGVYINRYAILTGEPYATYNWINGTLTNYNSIFSWYSMLYYLLNTEKYKMRHRDKLKILGYFGFLNHRSRLPGMGFITSTIASWKAVSEFWVIAIGCAAVVDSNTLSWNISLPIAGNDDSLICLNYYCYIVSWHIISAKVWNIKKFSELIKYKFKKSHFINELGLGKKMLLVYLYTNNVKKVTKSYVKIREKFMKEYDILKDPYKALDWKINNLKFEMAVFHTGFSILHNQDFFSQFGVLCTDIFDPEKDSVFYNDPYRLY